MEIDRAPWGEPARAVRYAHGHAAPPQSDPVLSLQRLAGNSAVTSLLRSDRVSGAVTNPRAQHQGRLSGMNARQLTGTLQRVDAGPDGTAGAVGAADQPVQARPQRHYRLEAKAWIPQFHVVDPEAPIGITAILGISPRALEKKMLDAIPPGSQPTGYQSHYRGDSHVPYDGPYRVMQVVEFDWDGQKIQNVTVPEVARFGASHRDVNIRYFNFRALDTRDLDDSESATAAGTVTHRAGDREVSIGIHSANPLTAAPSPDIDADVSVFLSSDPTFGTEEVTVRWTTDLMPSHGYRLVRDGTEVVTQITNDISGITATGPAAAAEIFLRLNSKSNGGSRTFSFLGSQVVQ